MNWGDFTQLAKYYINRPNYSLEVLKVIGTYVGMYDDGFRVAEVGAGTGKLTENLCELGLAGEAVEPNDAMREEGIRIFENNNNFRWSKGYAEDNGLEDNAYNWALMGSSFHWADTGQALEEFYRILKPGGFFTAIYVTRDIEGHELFEDIEKIVYSKMPDMKRVSSAGKKHNMDISGKLLSTDLFEDLFFVEAPHMINMSKERYMGIWRSVNDIRVQLGEKVFEEVLSEIEELIEPYHELNVPYLTRAWTVRSKNNANQELSSDLNTKVF